jgi:CRP/FNR family transcriptional regulator, cyclic AMP receptor protein
MSAGQCLAASRNEAAQSDLKMDWLKPFTSPRRIDAGDMLFRKGDAASAMYFIVSGRCRLTELGIDILPGQVVGELALLAPNQSRTQTLECVENGEVLQITYEQARQLYYQNPQFGFYFLQLTTRRLFENIAHLESELATRKIASAPATTG